MNSNERYERGYSLKGQRLYASKPGNRGERVSVIGALSSGNIISSMVYTGHCNANVFNSYIEQCLVPVLQKDQIVIMDNVSFHYSENAKTMIENAGCKIKYLPTYSPDLNLIEHQWFPMKNSAKKLMGTGISIQNALTQVLKKMSG